MAPMPFSRIATGHEAWRNSAARAAHRDTVMLATDSIYTDSFAFVRYNFVYISIHFWCILRFVLCFCADSPGYMLRYVVNTFSSCVGLL